MPSVLVKTAYDKVFISKEAKYALTYCLSTCKYSELLQVLMDCPVQGNKVLTENISGFIGVFIKNVDEKFFDIKIVPEN